MRVAVVSDWFAPRRGGIEVQLLELCERLADRGTVVEVITATPGARDGRNFRVHALDVLRLPVHDVAVSPAMLSRLRTQLQGYDVVHAHVSVVSPLAWAAAHAGRSLGVPVIVTFHSVLRAKAWLLRMVRALGGLSGGGITWTAVSRTVAAQAATALRAPVSVLPNGVDLDFWHMGPHAPVVVGPVTLVTAMRLQRKKRPRQLVRAFAHAKLRANSDARLVIVGDGPDRRAIERDVRGYGIADCVALLGWCDRSALRAAYAAAQGFALASTAESFGIAALEARAAGLPVIAMRGGSEEFLSHGADALLCEDDGDLEAALRRFLEDASLRRALASARPDLSRYDWNAVVAAHDAAYAAAIAPVSVGGVVPPSAPGSR